MEVTERLFILKLRKTGLGVEFPHPKRVVGMSPSPCPPVPSRGILGGLVLGSALTRYATYLGRFGPGEIHCRQQWP